MSRRVYLPLLCFAVAVGVVFFAAKKSKTNKPITPGPDTTVIVGPLDASGLIDYETALNEKLKGASTPDTNAVVLLVRAIGPKPENAEAKPDFYKWLGIAAPPADGDYLGKSQEFFKEEMQGGNPQEFHDHESELRNRPWTAKEEPKYADWIAANEKPLAVVAEAARRPDYFYPLIARDANGARSNLIFALLPHVQRLREVAAILSLRVVLRCGEKQYDAAWQDVMTMHRLARLIGKGATLIELLVGIAIDSIARNSSLRVLESANPTAPQALAWRDELAKLPPFPPLADKVATCERFTFLDVAQFLRRDGVEVFKQFNIAESREEPWDVVATTLSRTDWDKVLRTGNAWYDRFADALRKPTRVARVAVLKELEGELKELRAIAQSLDVGERMILLFLPAVEKVSEALDRQEVQVRTQRLAFALAAYRADTKAYPAKLADLVPKYAADISSDLFAEGGLIYRRVGAGYELYSVGPNGKDDGGQFIDDEPRGDDYGVRMPNAKRSPEFPPNGILPGIDN